MEKVTMLHAFSNPLLRPWRHLLLFVFFVAFFFFFFLPFLRILIFPTSHLPVLFFAPPLLRGWLIRGDPPKGKEEEEENRAGGVSGPIVTNAVQ